jgi:hypothetical protein
MSFGHTVLEGLAGTELRKHRGGDVEGGARLGIAAGPGRPVLGFEGAEAHQLELVACGQCAANSVEQGIQDLSDLGLGLVGLFSEAINEFCFIHGGSAEGGEMRSNPLQHSRIFVRHGGALPLDFDITG